MGSDTRPCSTEIAFGRTNPKDWGDVSLSEVFDHFGHTLNDPVHFQKRLICPTLPNSIKLWKYHASEWSWVKRFRRFFHLCWDNYPIAFKVSFDVHRGSPRVLTQVGHFQLAKEEFYSRPTASICLLAC